MDFADWLNYRLKTSNVDKIKLLAQDLLVENINIFLSENNKLLCQFLKIENYRDNKDNETDNAAIIDEVNDGFEFGNQFPV